MAIERGPHSTEPGERRQCKEWTMWAEDGIVFLEDRKDGHVHVLSCKQSLEQLHSYKAEASGWDKEKQNVDTQKRAYAIDYHGYLTHLIRILEATVEDAKRQGDPNDQQIRERKMRYFLRSKYSGTGLDSNKELTALFGANQDPIVFRPDVPWLATDPRFNKKS